MALTHRAYAAPSASRSRNGDSRFKFNDLLFHSRVRTCPPPRAQKSDILRRGGKDSHLHWAGDAPSPSMFAGRWRPGVFYKMFTSAVRASVHNR
jgi:hypothetical protein